MISAVTLVIGFLIFFVLSKGWIDGSLKNISSSILEERSDHSRLSEEFENLEKALKSKMDQLQNQVRQKASDNTELESQKQEIIKKNEEIEQVNRQLTESINYSKRIQNSILPDPRSIRKLVKGAFVYYQPRDVVSGDFYWFEKIRQGRSEYLIIACADCTGHGVPGAIMSMMGSNQLTNIIYYQNTIEPQKILARLDKAIKLELYRNESSDESKKEGMEIGICVIDLDELKLDFAGVGIPLYHVTDGELNTIKPVRGMIGGMKGEERDVEASIERVSLNIKEGDRLYMSSDGFQDQFGGPNDKKFLSASLRDLIKELSPIAMKDQEEKFKETFESWKGDEPQTDDVQVVGIEI